MATEKLSIVIDAVDLASGVLGGIGGALSAIGDAFSFVVGEARDAALVMAQTNAVLRSTQGVAGVTSAMVSDLADDLAKQTRFTDDALQSAENFLLTFKSINADIFPETLSLTADLATAWGMDLTSAATMIGKALEDPISGATALRRVGIQLTEQQQEMIKTMMEAGDQAGAQAVIMAELNAQVGGSAEAAAEAAGPWEMFSKRLGEVAETIGGPLMQAFDNVVLMLEPLITFIEGLAETFAMNAAAGGPLFAFQQLLMSLVPPELQAEFAQLMFAVQDVAAAFAETWPEIQPIVTELIVSLKNFLFPILNDGLKVAASLLRMFANFWREDGADIARVISDLVTKSLMFWETLMRLNTMVFQFGNTMFKAGADIVNGIVKGITSAPDAVTKALKKILDDAIANVKRALGIASPSKVMMGIGLNLMQGLEGGITRNAGLPAGAMRGVGDSLPGNIRNVTQNNKSNHFGNVQFIVQEGRAGLDQLSDDIFLQMNTAGA